MVDDATGTALEVGSDEWCRQALALTADLPVQAGLGYRVEHVVDDADRRWHQVVEDGKVVAWAPGALGDAELELHWSAADAGALYRGDLTGTEALDRVRVAVAGGPLGVASPFDITETAEYHLLPTVPDATLTAQYEFFAGPFGDADYHMAWVEGRYDDLGFGRVEEPDVVVRIAYGKMVRVRLHEITILEALEDGGRVSGDVGPLMLLAGMQESAEVQAAEHACGPSGAVLARMGEVAATPEHRVAMAALGEVTA